MFLAFTLLLCSVLRITSLEQIAEDDSKRLHHEGERGQARSAVVVGKHASMNKVRLHSHAQNVDPEHQHTHSKRMAGAAPRIMRKESSGEAALMETDDAEEQLDADDYIEADRSSWMNRRRSADCRWREWSAWSACSTTCGEGIHTRDRGEHSAQHGGHPCNGSMTAQKDCGNQVACPVDCATAALVGTDGHSRPVNCETSSQDCLWSVWSGWGACSVTCGDGVKHRNRTKVREVSGHGRPCDTDIADLEITCTETACSGTDCKWTEWEPWGPCSASCGGGERERARDKSATAVDGGKDCVGKPLEVGECQNNTCPVDCNTTQWTEWNDCTLKCGGGERKRRKKLITRNSHGGEPCPSDLEEKSTCNEDACPATTTTAPPGVLSTMFR